MIWPPGANHDAVRVDQPKRMRGAALPLHAQSLHPAAAAREKRAQADHGVTDLQDHNKQL